MNKWLSKIANQITKAAGSTTAMSISFFTLFLFLIAGSIIGFTEKLVDDVNICISWVTYLLLFAVQYTANRESRENKIRFDEILLKLKETDNKVLSVEEMGDKELENLHKDYIERSKE